MYCLENSSSSMLERSLLGLEDLVCITSEFWVGKRGENN